jgi:hypothetical protein
MKCDFCGKGRPKLFNEDGKFCNVKCHQCFVNRRER